jgi:hypothetical protein
LNCLPQYNKPNFDAILAKMSKKKSKIQFSKTLAKNNSIISKHKLGLFKFKTIKLIKFQSFSLIDGYREYRKLKIKRIL